MTDKVKVELVETNCLVRMPVDLGRMSEKEPILCEVQEGPYQGFMVDPYFLRDHGDLDEELEKEAVNCEERSRKLIESAASYRALKGGRLVLPTFEEWQEAKGEHDRKYIEECIASQEKWLAELKQMKAEGCDVDEDIARTEADLADLRGEEPMKKTPPPGQKGWRPWNSKKEAA